MADKRTVELVGKSVLAKELSPGDVELLAGIVEVRRLSGDALLYDAGHADSHMHVIVSGALGVSRRNAEGQWENLHVLTHGDLAGELSFIDGTPHYAALRALGDTEVLSLDRNDLETLIATNPWLVYRVMRAIARVTHTVQRRLSMQAAELTHYIYKNQAKY